MIEDKDERKKDETAAVPFLASPASLKPVDDHQSHRPSPNLLKLFSGLFKELRHGSDLLQLRLQVPAVVHQPKSELQLLGEVVYAFKGDLLKRCNQGTGPLERFSAVVAWAISTVRPLTFGRPAYNPVLGETHRVSNGTLNVLLEQTSHHPPVSCLHATDAEDNVELVWCTHPVVRFYGTKIEVESTGKRELKLLNHGEAYAISTPRFMFRFFPPHGDFIGDVRITCEKTKIEALLSFTTTSMIGIGSRRAVKGKIYTMSSPSSVLYELHGHWDSTVKMRDPSSGKEHILYDAETIISGLKPPVVEDPQKLWPSESAVVWNEVSSSIVSRNWKKADDSKIGIVNEQRAMAKERKLRGEEWVPRYFTSSLDKENGCNCKPIHKLVEEAPIVFYS